MDETTIRKSQKSIQSIFYTRHANRKKESSLTDHYHQVVGNFAPFAFNKFIISILPD
jgi:D-tyrosyl-tRNA(Tyr) deacylase